MSSAVADGPQIRHVIPGRIRIHWPAWSGQRRLALETHLSRLPGVRSARANPLTGTILLHFDPTVTDTKTLLSAVRTIGPGRLAGQSVKRLVRVIADRHTLFRLVLQVVEHALRAEWKATLPAAAGVLASLQRLPLIRAALRHLLGRALADLFLQVTEAVAALFAADPLDRILSVADSILQLTPPSPRFLLAG